ncbi:MAG: hypothetical protein MZV70_61975 [Desulfobacterales bacterium]|nr:hypothetical protein [Desulfobacterales bacterium]
MLPVTSLNVFTASFGVQVIWIVMSGSVGETEGIDLIIGDDFLRDLQDNVQDPENAEKKRMVDSQSDGF